MMRIEGRGAMRLLRNTLRANAAFSTLSGTTMVIGGAGLGAWLGRDGSVAVDGVILLGFAAFLLWLTRNEAVSLKAAWVVVALDLVYVIDVAVKIAGGAFSAAGNLFYGAASLVVLALAVTQTVGILSAGEGSRTPATTS